MATLEEIERHWDLDDVLDATAILDERDRRDAILEERRRAELERLRARAGRGRR